MILKPNFFSGFCNSIKGDEHEWLAIITFSALNIYQIIIKLHFIIWIKIILQGYQKYDKRELQLMDEFFKIKSDVNATLLCNTIDMKFIGKKMCQIIDLGEKYINEMVGSYLFHINFSSFVKTRTMRISCLSLIYLDSNPENSHNLVYPASEFRLF